MLEIEGKDISELGDSDLRSLIGLLCEADLRAMNLPTAGVTWGGHQNAKDGGIDVRIELTTALHNDSFVARSKTGFQVKKPDMPRTAIINEMRPNGELRQVIKDLIDAKGAYIIVSSQGSTADSALKDRKQAMRDALSDCPNHSDIKVDFYDRERIAGWVRSHPSLVLWVRDKIGRPIQGWQAYGNWAGSPNGIEEEYMLDEHIRLLKDAKARSEGLSAIDGINEIRTILQQPSSSVRLVGLSGVGKTRLLQALFDERIGENSLNPSLVFYTDISDSPNPDPRNFAERIIALQKPAILAIDNCPPDLHRRLTSVCSTRDSLVSLITVEYDVREDQPEETEVIRLEPASAEIIEKVILSRFCHLNEVGARSIAKFSGGNARIAIALAGTVKRGENLTELRDNELFNRLFQQRNEPNSSLMRSAEACSLVYSFNNQTVEDANIELRLLSSLVDMSVREVYENVSELKRRDLVQQRSVWRAVLPHAIANKLAQRALENIPIDKICNVFEKGGSDRLLKSFSRRMSYLHECEAAIEISRRWLMENGLLEDVSNLNELGISLLYNIAPLNPELTLSAIEKVAINDDAHIFYSRDNPNYNKFTRILRSLAYDKNLFIRSGELLCRFALSEKPDENYNSIRNLLKPLFYIYLSGTHATKEQRLNIIKQLVESNFDNEIDLGISLLDATLETEYFSSHDGFEFGARPRDYGFTPRNREEIHQWYKLFIEYSVKLAVSELPVASKAKNLLAKKFYGLWTKAGMYDELEAASRNISIKDSWKEGWIAVRTTKRFDGEKMEAKIYTRLNDLDIILEPISLIERARLYALSHGDALDLVDTVGDQDVDEYSQLDEITRSIGREVGSQGDLYKEMLPEILSIEGPRLFSFGQGLADGCVNSEKMWRDFCNQLLLLEKSKHNYQVLRGFLNRISEIDIHFTEKILNEAVTDKVLATVYPLLQTSVKINSQGAKRLKQSLEYGIAPIWQYKNLAYGRVHETICDDDLSELLRIMFSKPSGIEVAIYILYMRIHGYSKGGALSDIIQSLGQELLLKYQFSRIYNRGIMDYEIARVIKACFTKESAKDNARVLCSRLVKSIENNEVYSMDCKRMLNTLAQIQPLAFLDEFLGKDVKLNHRILGMLSKEVGPISQIDDDLIINWCEVDPKKRYPILASAIVPFQKRNDEKTLEWTTLAQEVINNFDDQILILNKFKSSFWPNSWTGSLAEKLQSRLRLISDLINHENSLVADWAKKEERKFKETIRLERERKLKREREQNERFE
ncbi:hypothetical protein ABGT24_26105 [Peribacillus frigoritolerans]|uniref:hypothetical protein n=1 Tax=Peribacillus frigoritolerans TaxID=450367 RepID=UPI00345DFA68